MATVKDATPHIIRTAEDPRQAGTFSATLSRIEQVNSQIRLLRLSLKEGQSPLRHFPGQYIDLSIPNISTVGGFTITSPPQTALITRSPTTPVPYIELAIQDSPRNPPAAFLWRPGPDILGTQVSFRIGGSFIYPPLQLSRDECARFDRAVFIAGGVGINPIMSMLSAMDLAGPKTIPGGMVKSIRILYSSQRRKSNTNGKSTAEDGGYEEILFENRLRNLATKWSNIKDTAGVDLSYTFFETGQPPLSSAGVQPEIPPNMQIENRRISHADLLEAIGPEDDRSNTVVYICGLPTMTDEFVEILKNAKGMHEKRVLCEKWW